MQPVSPVVAGFEDLEVVYAKDHPEYLPLPALPSNQGNGIITHWKLSWRERFRAFLFGDVYLRVLNFQRPLQPVSLTVTAPKLSRV